MGKIPAALVLIALLPAIQAVPANPTDQEEPWIPSTPPYLDETTIKNRPCQKPLELEERHKELVKKAYLSLYSDHDIDSADKYFHKYLIQHNPLQTDGVEGLKAFAKIYTTQIPKGKVEIKKISADGDLVWTHVKFPAPGGKFYAAMDIFRVQEGMIVEHWDVIQKIPELKDAKNPHPLF